MYENPEYQGDPNSLFYLHLANHVNTRESGDAGAIIAVIIGCIMLVTLIGALIYKSVVGKRNAEMSKARSGTYAINQSSFRSV